MAIRYVKEFEFPSAAGYSKSTPSKVTGPMFAKGGHAKKYADGGGVDSAGMAQMAGDAAATQDAQSVMTTPPMTPQQKQKLLMLQAAKRRAMMAGQDTRMNDVPPSANYDADQMARAERGYKKGGKVSKVMHEFGEGKLHSGSKKGPKVTNPKQAIAIALSEQRASKKARGGLESQDGSPLSSVSVKDIKSGKIPQSTDEDYYGKAKDAPMPPRRPSNLKKGGMAHEDVAEDKSLIKSMVKPGALKKADGGGVMALARPNMARMQPAAPARLMGTPQPANRMPAQYTPAQQSALQSMPANAARNMSTQQLSQMADQRSRNAALAASQAAQNAPRGAPAAQAQGPSRLYGPTSKPMKKGGGVKKADGGGIAMPSPLQQMAARTRGVPVAPRGPMIPQQAAPAGGARIGVNASRPGGPNVGALRAAMARKASQAMPENAPGMMKKGGKVGC